MSLTVLDEADTIVAAAVGMKSAMRGYLLAGEETFLDPYQNGVMDVYSNFARLREIVSDNPVQVAKLTEAEHVLLQWQNEVAKRQIELRRAIGVAAIMHTMVWEVRKGEGKVHFDNFRDQIGTFIGSEEALLEQCQSQCKKGQFPGVIWDSLFGSWRRLGACAFHIADACHGALAAGQHLSFAGLDFSFWFYGSGAAGNFHRSFPGYARGGSDDPEWHRSGVLIRRPLSIHRMVGWR